MDPSSIPKHTLKIKGEGDIYICGIYLSVLNCGYINDRIISDWNKDDSYNRGGTRGDSQKKKIGVHNFLIWESLYNELNYFKINERVG